MKEEEKIFRGILFRPGDPELKAMKLRSHKLSAEYSRTNEDDVELRARLLELILLEFGEGSFIQGPVFFHYGKHTRIGKRCFFNYNLTIQDDAPVVIGDDNNFGPNTTIVTPVHPMLPDERRTLFDKDGHPGHYCYARPVTIGSDCWFGANVVVCPGVTIGDGSVRSVPEALSQETFPLSPLPREVPAVSSARLHARRTACLPNRKSLLTTASSR